MSRFDGEVVVRSLCSLVMHCPTRPEFEKSPFFFFRRGSIYSISQRKVGKIFKSVTPASCLSISFSLLGETLLIPRWMTGNFYFLFLLQTVH